MKGHLCAVCGGEVKGSSSACKSCVKMLMDDVKKLVGWRTEDGRQVHGLIDDLLITGARLDVMPPTGGTQTKQESNEEDNLPVTTSQGAAPARLDALNLRSQILSALVHLTKMVNQVGESGLGYHEDIEYMVRLVSGEHGLMVRAQEIVDRPQGAFRLPCPECERRVPIEVDAVIITCLCGVGGGITWWMSQLAPELPEQPTITARDFVAWLARRYGVEITEQAIWQWAVRYPAKLERRGRDEHGRTLYDSEQLKELALDLHERRNRRPGNDSSQQEESVA